jgi:hypothetical protein
MRLSNVFPYIFTLILLISTLISAIAIPNPKPYEHAVGTNLIFVFNYNWLINILSGPFCFLVKPIFN